MSQKRGATNMPQITTDMTPEQGSIQEKSAQITAQREEMYHLTYLMLGTKSFFESLTDSERYALCAIQDAKRGVLRTVPTTSEEVFYCTIQSKWKLWQNGGDTTALHQRFYPPVNDPSDPFASVIEEVSQIEPLVQIEPCGQPSPLDGKPCHQNKTHFGPCQTAAHAAWLRAERQWTEQGVQPGAYTAFKAGFEAHAKIAEAKDPSVPEFLTTDTDIYELNFADKIQVQIDRTKENMIQICVWNIGDDYPLDVIDAELPALTDCFSCRCRVGSAYLTDGYCSTCLEGYTPDEFVRMRNFAEGFRAARRFDYVDEWAMLPDDSKIDIHFQTEETPDDAEDHGKLTAWAYRRDKHVEGDCVDGIRLF